MEKSLFWKKRFIPVYFIAAVLLFLLFHFYIQNVTLPIYLLAFMLIGLGVASIIYNSKKEKKNKL
ncbi:hypothetical protein [Staphylococcus debuckii]|uniref:Mobilization protein n=1 Tax=Staphylococcus debuckii TaxID=2044912 RepID=A0ABU9EV77_9STAP